MFRFPSINIDSLSFWLGFLGGSIFWWLINQFRKLFPILKENFRRRQEAIKVRREAGVQAYFLGYYRKLFEEAHIAVDIFPYSKVFIKPEFLAPPPPPSDDPDKTEGFLITKILPYLPECPNVLSDFGWPTLTCQDILKCKNHFVLIGQPGTGKTTALLSLTIDTLENSINTKLPLYINFLDISISNEIPVDQQLFDALALPNDKAVKILYKDVILSKILSGDAILLLDGLDELSHQYFQEATHFIEFLIEKFPNIQVITTATPDYLDGLTKLPVTTLGLKTWKTKEVNCFIDSWAVAWNELLPSPLPSQENQKELIQSIILQWMKSTISVKSPLEMTLYIWSALSRDIKGDSVIDLYQSYISRKIDREKVLSTFSTTALKVIDNNKSWFDIEDVTSTELSYLLSSGLFYQHKSNRFSLIHISFLPFLASLCTERNESLIETTLPVWAPKVLLYSFSPQASDSQRWFEFLINQNDIVLNRDIEYLSVFIRDIPEDSSFRTAVMKKIVERAKNESLPFGSRIWVISACSATKEPGLLHLFKQFLTSNYPIVRRLGLIGIGTTHQEKALKEITALLNDKDIDTRHLAIFTMIPLDSIASTQLLAELLLNGSEEMRFAAAQSFAKLGGEGHEVLQEAVTMEDLVTRRAAVVGLQTVREKWAHELLEKISMEDGQWVVRNAAARAVESVDEPFMIINSLPIWEQPWLIEFASKKGIGVTPTEDQTGLLLEAIKHGLPTEKIFALQNLACKQEEGVIGEIYRIVFGEESSVRSEASRTLSLIAASGSKLPPPIEYGLV